MLKVTWSDIPNLKGTVHPKMNILSSFTHRSKPVWLPLYLGHIPCSKFCHIMKMNKNCECLAPKMTKKHHKSVIKCLNLKPYTIILIIIYLKQNCEFHHFPRCIPERSGDVQFLNKLFFWVRSFQQIIWMLCLQIRSSGSQVQLIVSTLLKRLTAHWYESITQFQSASKDFEYSAWVTWTSFGILLASVYRDAFLPLEIGSNCRG